MTVRLGDAGRRDRLALEVAGTTDLVWSDEVADIVVVDDLSSVKGTAELVVLLAEPEEAELPRTVRALLPLDAAPRTVVAAIRLVAEGLLIMPEGARDQPATERREEDDGAPRPLVPLTPREQEVLELLAAGASNKEIARQLDVSVHTVKFHVASVLRKLGADGRLEAVGNGLRTGLLML